MNTAIESWARRVDAHHAQTRKAESAMAPSFASSKSLASYFAADPNRKGDPILTRLLEEIGSEVTVLDVGGGAGRYALPIALNAKYVTVVEPSPDMKAELVTSAQKSSITNIHCVQQSWLDAAVEPAGVVLCASVVDGVSDIQSFITKLAAHANKKVVLLQSVESPLAAMSGLWREIHGESREEPPGMRELVQVLWEMDILPNVEMLEPQPIPAIQDRDRATHFLGQMLFVAPGTKGEAALMAAWDHWLVETRNGYSIRGAGPRLMALISWNVD